MTITAKIRALLLSLALPLAAGAPVSAQNQTAAPAKSPTQTPGQTPGQTNAQTKAQSATQSRAKVDNADAKGVDEKPETPRTGILVDQVIGVVNGDLILESDVDQERRFGVFQPFTSPAGPFSRDQAIERLEDRDLILQQARLQPEDRVTDAQATAELAVLRRDIPACKQFRCETDAGWARFVQAQGFTVPSLTEMWRQRMQVLKFVEQRFRAGIRIEPTEIKTYYDTNLLPEYAKQKVKPPPLDSISDRIQEVLLQQRVGALLSDWLLQLKAQGSVRMMRPDEVAP